MQRPTTMKEIIIRMRPDSDKCHQKALKVAAAVSGVESVTVAGRDRDLLLVIGDGVDESKLTKKLRREVGEAEILELRTLDAGGGGGAAASLQLMTAAGARNGKGGGGVVFAQSSPYHG
uniref:HMA domain-containing protein n=1 Tax=Oryza meridionalis TaxID=40149 RepID=A0A0E0DF44_9ORYZ